MEQSEALKEIRVVAKCECNNGITRPYIGYVGHVGQVQLGEDFCTSCNGKGEIISTQLCAEMLEIPYKHLGELEEEYISTLVDYTK